MPCRSHAIVENKSKNESRNTEEKGVVMSFDWFGIRPVNTTTPSRRNIRGGNDPEKSKEKIEREIKGI